MITGILAAFLLWAILFVGCILYAVLTKKSYINVSMLCVLLLGMVLCGATYGAMFDFVKWVLS